VWDNKSTAGGNEAAAGENKQMTAQDKMTARFASMNTDVIKQVLAGVFSLCTPEAATVRGMAYCALEARIGEDAAEAYFDGLSA